MLILGICSQLSNVKWGKIMANGINYRVKCISSSVMRSDFYNSMRKDLLQYVDILKTEKSLGMEGKFARDLSEKNVKAIISVLGVLCDAIFTPGFDVENENLYSYFERKLKCCKEYKELLECNSLWYENSENVSMRILDCFFHFIEKYFCGLPLDFPIVKSFRDIEVVMLNYGFHYSEISVDSEDKSSKKLGCFYSVLYESSGLRRYSIVVKPNSDGYHMAIDIIPQLRTYNTCMCNSLVDWSKLFPRDYSGFEKVLKERSKPSYTPVYYCPIPQ